MKKQSGIFFLDWNEVTDGWPKDAKGFMAHPFKYHGGRYVSTTEKYLTTDPSWRNFTSWHGLPLNIEKIVDWNHKAFLKKKGKLGNKKMPLQMGK